MRIFIPNRKLRLKVVDLLEIAFDTDDFDEVREAAKIVKEYYRLPHDIRVTARKKLKCRKDAALCWEDARIDILRPSVWKAENRPRKTWVHTVLHEFGHAVLWADGETKADLFADRWYGEKVRR